MLPLNALPPRQAEKQTEQEEMIYTEDDLEPNITLSSESSYFEKAQDFKAIIKILRIKYLGLKPITSKDKDGITTTVYKKDKNRMTGINEEGVEMNVRFLETRLGKHSVLTNWSEERMGQVILDDMITWCDIHEINYDKFEMTPATLEELRILINDLLEYAYRRPIDNLERSDMKPSTTELMRRMLGIGDNPMQQQGRQETTQEMLRQDKGMPSY